MSLGHTCRATLYTFFFVGTLCCEECGSTDSRPGQCFLVCDGCDKGGHDDCLHEEHTAARPWFCPYCKGQTLKALILKVFSCCHCMSFKQPKLSRVGTFMGQDPQGLQQILCTHRPDFLSSPHHNLSLLCRLSSRLVQEVSPCQTYNAALVQTVTSCRTHSTERGKPHYAICALPPHQPDT